MKVNWQEVADKNPQGYLELNDGRQVIHGPIEKMIVDDNDFVQIYLKWAAQATLVNNFPDKWTKAADEAKIVSFPNWVVPFEIESTEEKGQRVRFGTNILYFDKQTGLDPSKVEGLVSTPKDPKKLFHKVIEDLLLLALVGVGTDIASPKVAELITVLEILYRSKMPAEAAHQIARDNTDLVGLLQKLGQKELAEFAARVIDDLHNREDGKKEKLVAT